MAQLNNKPDLRFKLLCGFLTGATILQWPVLQSENYPCNHAVFQIHAPHENAIQTKKHTSSGLQGSSLLDLSETTLDVLPELGAGFGQVRSHVHRRELLLKSPQLLQPNLCRGLVPNLLEDTRQPCLNVLQGMSRHNDCYHDCHGNELHW